MVIKVGLTLNTILIPCDLSEPSCRAIQTASAIGPAARLVVLHVLPPLNTKAGNVIATAADAQAKQQEAVSQLKALGPVETNVDYRVAFGHAARQILVTARDCQADLIVMPARSHSAVEHAVLGSVTHHVLRSASGPVLVVPVLPG